MVHKQDIQTQARKMCRKLGNFQASDAWVRRFIERNNMQLLVADYRPRPKDILQWK